MPHVRKADLLHVVRELWSSTGILEDEAKLILAEKLINDTWEGKKSGLPMNQAGIPIKAALGDRWLTSNERTSAGKPQFRAVLSEDPYFILKDSGGSHPNVKLRISRLAQLIENPELIQEYRRPANASSGGGPGGGSSSTKGPAPPAKLTDEGLPIRPGQPNCAHFLKHGWCLFKADCWYNHPPDRGARKRAATPEGGVLIESHLEPGVMLRDGVYPIRQGTKLCGFYAKNGWCMFKAKCRNHHPPLREIQGDSASNASSSSRATPSPTPSDQPDAPLVKQPPTQLLLGVLFDAVWPPRSSKEAFVKGALARHIISEHLELPGDVQQENMTYNVPGSQAGDYLIKWWRSQQLYDPSVKPYKSLVELLAGDPYYRTGLTPKGAPQISLLLGFLIESGGQAAGEKLSSMADAVWPPASGREAWLRGKLAKWLMSSGFKVHVLRQVLAVGPDAPTVFRIDMAQAGEYLKRSWQSDSHPYDSSTTPWTKLNPLIAGDRFLYIEPAPGRPSHQHVSLDLEDMLQHFPAIARAARKAQQQQQSAAGSSSAAAAAGGASSSSSRAGGSGPSSSAAAAPGEEVLDLDEEESEDEILQSLSGGGWSGEVTGAAGVAGPSSSSGGGSSSSAAARPQQQQVMRSSRPGSAAAAGGAGVSPADAAAAELAQAQADLKAIAECVYEPPADMQWWWPERRAENPAYCWTEIAIRLLDPAGEDFEIKLAEMVQHLEISPVLAMACATYKSHPHLLQFFAPHTAIGGLEMPAAVYLLDIMRPGPQIQQVLELVRPVLSSPTNTKVCHGSKLWSGQLEKAFNIRLVNYFDTQAANYAWNCLRFESGRASHMNPVALKNTAEVSLSSLLRTNEFYHPVRHTDHTSGKDAPLLWQDRPLSEELITCAAADVAYLLPLMEVQVRNLARAASDVRQQQQQQRPGSRAAALLTTLPPELSDSSTIASIAAGAEARGGSVSFDRIREWGGLAAFHQAPLHDVNLSLHQSYGALRGVGRASGR